MSDNEFKSIVFILLLIIFKVLGWGLTSNDGKPSSELKEVQVKYRDYSECLNNIPANFKQYLATGDKMCGGNTNQSTFFNTRR